MATPRTDLWEIAMRVPAEAEEPVAALLERVLGESPVVYVDFETGERWVSVYAPSALGLGRRRQLQEGWNRIEIDSLPPGAGALSCTRVRRADWAHAWKIHFRPIRIAGKLILRPSWRRVTRRSGEVVITLDPGLAFGTGHHPTTAFCLEQLVDFQRGTLKRGALLDVGTGSGILAIAAAKLGYGPIEAIDLEEDSVRIAWANARRNRVAHKMRILRGDVRRLAKSKERFDVVCANLVSDLLGQVRHRLAGRLATGGRLVLAGILAEQFSQVEQAYLDLGFEVLKTSQTGEWKSGVFGRPVS